MRVGQQRTTAASTNTGGTSSRFLQNVQRFQGQPYRWGGGHSSRTGVQPVDCSGLVQQAAAMAGVRVQGRARDMQRMGQAVSMNNLKPGDLVFRGSPAHHVGIYMGNGQVMHAPRRGQPVQYTSVRGFTSARRIPGLSGGTAPAGSVPASSPRTSRPAARQHHQPAYQPAARRATSFQLPNWHFDRHAAGA